MCLICMALGHTEQQQEALCLNCLIKEKREKGKPVPAIRPSSQSVQFLHGTSQRVIVPDPQPAFRVGAADVNNFVPMPTPKEKADAPEPTKEI